MLMNGRPYNAFVSSLQFGVFTEEEILERSVVEVNHEVAFDKLGYPNRNGLYDLRMGPYQRDGLCDTCGRPWINCPGHFGHIVLASTMYNPNLFSYIYDLLKSKCFFCHRLRVAQSVLDDVETELVLLDAGMYMEAVKLADLSSINHKHDALSPEDMTIEDAVDLTMGKDDYKEKYLRKAYKILRERNGLPTIPTSSIQEFRHGLYKYLLSKVNNRCPYCKRVSPKLFKQGAIKIFRGRLNSKHALLNMKYGVGALSDDVFRFDLDYINKQLMGSDEGIRIIKEENSKSKSKGKTKAKKTKKDADAQQDTNASETAKSNNEIMDESIESQKRLNIFTTSDEEAEDNSEGNEENEEKEESEVDDDTIVTARQAGEEGSIAVATTTAGASENGIMTQSQYQDNKSLRLYMPSVEVAKHMKYLFKVHKSLFNNMFGEPKQQILKEGEEETKTSGMYRREFSYKQLFFKVLPVIPTRFRLPNTMSDSRSISGKAYYDSPINMILSKIIQSNNTLLRLQFFCKNEDIKSIVDRYREQQGEGDVPRFDNSIDEMQKFMEGKTSEEKQSRLLYASLKLQDDINLLCDATKCINVASMAINRASDNNRASASSSGKVLNGLRQTIEKKQGIVRKNLMGKRVNYAGRSVISPDPYIGTDEIGIPVMFAMTLSFPEPVNEGCIVKDPITGQYERRTSGNIKVLRKLVINGPNIYPGANYIVDENNRTILLGKYSKEMRESIAKSLGKSVVEIADSGLSSNPSIGRVKIVGRHLLNGDPLLVNRQPTLHRNSIMCHKAYVFDTTEKPSEEHINYNGNGFGNSFSVSNISNILNDSAITTNRDSENWNNMYVINNYKPKNVPNTYKMSTIRMHFTNCQSYNADFDGDEINVHCPQSYEARAEALNLMLNDNLYSSITSGAPIRGIIQDHVVSGVMLTKRNTFLDRKTFMELVFVGCNTIDPNIPIKTHNDYSILSRSKKYKESSEAKKTSLNKIRGMFEISSVIDRPAILYPKKVYTGKQVISQMLLHLGQSRGMPYVNLIGDTKIPIKLWMDSNHLTDAECKSTKERTWYSFDNMTVIRQGELLSGLVEKNHISNTANGLVHTINDTYGNINNNPSNPDANGSASGRMLTALGRMLQRYIQYIGFTCRLEDMILTPKGDAERAKILGQMNAKAIDGVKEFLELDIQAAKNSGEEDMSATFIQKALVTKLKHLQKHENSMPGSHGGSKGLGSPLLDSLVTSQMNAITSDCISSVVPSMLLNNSYTNNLNMMITSKAKGSNVNQSQIVVCLGQQSLEGRRPPMLPTGKTLPLYETVYSKNSISGQSRNAKKSNKDKYVIECPDDVDAQDKIGSEAFGKFSQSAHANGYISGRFLTGLPAPSFYFHCMAGREGLVDTAVKTANSGYLQRCLIKGMENITVAYNGMTVENIGSNSSRSTNSEGKEQFNGGGNIIQFLYGEDGRSVDSTIANGIAGISMNWKIYAERLNKMMKNIPSGALDNENEKGEGNTEKGMDSKAVSFENMTSKSIKSKLGYLGYTRVLEWEASRKKILKKLSSKKKKRSKSKSSNEKLSKSIALDDVSLDGASKSNTKFTCITELPPHLNFGAISEKFRSQVDAFVAANKSKIQIPSSTNSSSRSSSVSGKKKHKKSKSISSPTVGSSETIDDQNNRLLSPNDLFSRNAALRLNQAGHLSVERLRLMKPRSLFSILCSYSYYHSLVHPMSPVGVISGESIGEPSTQMTLNTFHQAGVGGANVTLGIPRLRQILMSGTVSGKPMMTVRAAKPSGSNEINNLESLRSLITNVTVIDIINKLTCVEKIGTGLTIEKGETIKTETGALKAITRTKEVAGKRREYHITLEIEKNKMLPNKTNSNAAAVINMKLIRIGFLNLLGSVTKLLYKEGLGKRPKTEEQAETKDADASVIIKKHATANGSGAKAGKGSRKRKSTEEDGDNDNDDKMPEYDPDAIDGAERIEKEGEDDEDEVGSNNEDSQDVIELDGVSSKKAPTSDTRDKKQGNGRDKSLRKSSSKETMDASESNADENGNTILGANNKGSSESITTTSESGENQSYSLGAQSESTEKGKQEETAHEEFDYSKSIEIAMKKFVEGFSSEETTAMLKIPSNIISNVVFVVRRNTDAKEAIASSSYGSGVLDMINFLSAHPEDKEDMLNNIIFRFEFIISCPLNQRKLLITNLVERAAIATPLRNVKGIEGGYLDVKEKKLLCNGQNIAYIHKLPESFVNHQEIRTSDIKEILRVYGVEAARSAIIEEISNVFNMYHIDVNVRHIALIADKMTHNGMYLTFSRHGLLSASEAPVVQRMSFETALTSMTIGCIRGECDFVGGNGIYDGHDREHNSESNVRGIGGAAEGNLSAAVAIGRCIPIGTGGIDLFTKIPTTEEEEVTFAVPPEDHEEEEEEAGQEEDVQEQEQEQGPDEDHAEAVEVV